MVGEAASLMEAAGKEFISVLFLASVGLTERPLQLFPYGVTEKAK